MREFPPCSGPGIGRTLAVVPQFLLRHRHSAADCRFAYAAWNGFESPLRRNEALSSCSNGEHSIVWTVAAADEAAALAQLPDYVAERTEVLEVSEVAIP